MSFLENQAFFKEKQNKQKSFLRIRFFRGSGHPTMQISIHQRICLPVLKRLEQLALLDRAAM